MSSHNTNIMYYQNIQYSITLRSSWVEVDGNLKNDFPIVNPWQNSKPGMIIIFTLDAIIYSNNKLPQNIDEQNLNDK